MIEKLKLHIESSVLGDVDKKVWHDFLNGIDEESAGDIYEAVSESNNNLLFLTENLKNKFQALQEKNQNRWQEIITEEKNYLEKL